VLFPRDGLMNTYKYNLNKYIQGCLIIFTWVNKLEKHLHHAFLHRVLLFHVFLHNVSLVHMEYMFGNKTW
jgi:hypothetical protein